MTDFNISEAINELQKQKNIPRGELVEALETALASAYRKNFDVTGNVEVKISDTGINVFSAFQIVDEIDDAKVEVTLAQIEDENPDGLIVGDIYREEVTPDSFGRIAAQTAKQVIMQKIREAERRMTYDAFAAKIDTLIVAHVQRFDRGDILVNHMGVEMVLPVREQIPGERYRNGDIVKAVVAEVNRTAKGPQIVLSRANHSFLARLFEQEIPEIQDKLVSIKGVAREPGIRAKVAVSSTDKNVDPIGACVGLRGSRIQVIVNEVQGEKIDIIHWSEDIGKFVGAALSPVKPVNIDYDAKTNKVTVHVPRNQLSLAIGREGQNVRLAAKLTNVRIDITSTEDNEDGSGHSSKN